MFRNQLIYFYVTGLVGVYIYIKCVHTCIGRSVYVLKNVSCLNLSGNILDCPW